MNQRGEFWVLAQIVLLGGIVMVPRVPGAFLPWPEGVTGAATLAGLVVGGVGAAFLILGALSLGTNLTIFPRPKDDSTLTQGGLYALVRHPIYCGVILLALGWSLVMTSTAALLITVALIAFFDRKATREERWLMEKFPDYASYRQRVRKLIPFIY
jgi:protein-S-isoprenylcysteine O-methyltransferase Ste14